MSTCVCVYIYIYIYMHVTMHNNVSVSSGVSGSVNLVPAELENHMLTALKHLAGGWSAVSHHTAGTHPLPKIVAARL